MTVGKEKRMNTKKHRRIPLIVCVLCIFVMFASLFYIVKEETHHCTGEDCPICACIRQAEQTLRNWGTAASVSMGVDLVMISSVSSAAARSLYVLIATLVSQKVRLND